MIKRLKAFVLYYFRAVIYLPTQHGRAFRNLSERVRASKIELEFVEGAKPENPRSKDENQ